MGPRARRIGMVEVGRTSGKVERGLLHGNERKISVVARVRFDAKSSSWRSSAYNYTSIITGLPITPNSNVQV